MFIIYGNTVNAQFRKTDNKIFNTIISKQIENGLTTFYIKCSKPKTFFKKKTFLNETHLKNIPEIVLTELERASNKKIKTEHWDCSLFKKNIPFLEKKCIGDEKSERILQKKGRTTIFEIHKPLFDKKTTHCIVQVVVIRKKGEFSSSLFLLKKIYGKWIILEEFNFVSS
jgi:hypothetical protein